MIVPCSHCGKDLKRAPSEILRKPYSVCGRECLRELRRNGTLRCGGVPTPVYGEPRQCSLCRETFPCTEKHFGLWLNGRGHREWSIYCLYCNAERCWMYAHPEARRESEAA